MTTPTEQLRAHWPYQPPAIVAAYEVVEHRDPAPKIGATLLSLLRGALSLLRGALIAAWLGIPIGLLHYLLLRQLGW